ncbi:MAG TPA: S8 family serine peptidase [Chloroflexota bacterium]|nr:S8 family serine peptidase [Chloroflexota bacterium]
MKKIWFLTIILISGFFLVVFPAISKGQEAAEAGVPAAPPTDQIIIQFTDPAAEARMVDMIEGQELPLLSQVTGVSVTYVRPMSGDAHVLKLPTAVPPKEAAQIAAEMAELEGVAYAEPDLIKTVDGRAQRLLYTPELTPNDTRFNEQWHYMYTPGTSEGLNLVNAWNLYTGSNSTVVAVIDTGILNHNDLAGKIVGGYDFIHDAFVGNDGDGRDNNPADPGDWVLANECGFPHSAQNSSWHGTHVAGTIAAATNNNLGVAGVNWNARILPVRVLGKCGGYTSDIVDGMRWSAGLSVTGVPANANPAKVLNLSLGGSGACSTSEQNAINAIVAAGSVVVVAAGNDNANAANYTPASCNNVITVAANDRTGDRAFYSNFGSVIEVTAPGGETTTLANGILSTLDSGTTTPANSHTYAFYQGTSMATPHVAGLASLIVGLRPSYTPAQVLSLLQSTARAFPAGSTCNTSNCGAGIVDAFQALTQLSVVFDEDIYLPVVLKPAPPPPPPPPPSPIVNPGFESGPTGWTEYSTHGWDLILNSGFPPGVTPHNGSWAVWLGGDTNEVAYIQQSVTVPAGTPYLAYWNWIASQDACGYDFGSVQVNGTTVHQYNLCTSTNTGGWVKRVVNLGAYSGQTITLRIRATTDSSLNSNLFIDDVAFQASAGAPEMLPVPGNNPTQSRQELTP